MNFLRIHREKISVILILIITLVSMSIFVFLQPFGDGPDEINRYKVVSYIETYGQIPKGDEPLIIIDGYGASYAFQPILTYMVEGFLLRILSPLSLSFDIKLIIARYVNVLIGLISAFYTIKLSKLIFDDESAAYLFSLSVILLPQNIFIYTYVNTDGMGLMSVIIMIYSIIRGYKHDFDRRSLISLSVSISLCLLSYYNCYGYILMAFIAFILYFALNRSYRQMFIKGLPVALSVLVLAGWWFIRNCILYGGDIFALNARRECALATGNILWLENMANTYQAQGYSLYEMVFETDYYTLVWKSFIAMFGPMAIPTHHYVYMGFKYLTVICLLSLLIPIRSKIMDTMKSSYRYIIWSVLILGMLIPIILALYYSYTWDFQPQGRYYLPCLVPLAMILNLGMYKLISSIYAFIQKHASNKKAPACAKAFIYLTLYAFFFMSLVISLYKLVSYYKA